MTDGLDAGSDHSEQQAVEAAVRSEVSVYTILVSVGQHSNNGNVLNQHADEIRQRLHDRGLRVLQDLSQQTGGSNFEVDKEDHFKTIYEQITTELRNQYRIGLLCDEKNSAPGYHTLSLKTKRTDLTVRSREGFYFGDPGASPSTRNATPDTRPQSTAFVADPLLSQARDFAIDQQSTPLRFAAHERIHIANTWFKDDQPFDSSVEVIVDQTSHTVRRRVDQSAVNHLRMLGVTAVGEFGLELPNIFHALSLSEFYAVQDGATTLRKYNFAVGREASTWQIWDGVNWLPVPYAGTIWVDSQTHHVTRLERIATALPADLNASLVQSVIDFASADLDGHKPLMLPAHSEERICQRDTPICAQISSSIQRYSAYQSFGVAVNENSAPPGPDQH